MPKIFNNGGNIEPHLFKIWSRNRIMKTLVLVNGIDGALKNLISKASEKLHINGVSVVLECDGTPIDDDAIFMKAQTLILLAGNEEWVPATKEIEDNISSRSSTSTVTLLSSIPDDHDSTLTNNLSDTASEDLLNTSLLFFDTNQDFVWTNYKVPWEKLPKIFLKSCEEGERDKQIITQIIHTIVSEMRNLKKNIPMKAFRNVAKQLIDKFPITFRDMDDDGVVMGDGTHSIVCKLSDRNNYLNRPHKRARKDENDVPTKFLKKKLNSAVGCHQWNPLDKGNSSEDKIKKINSLDTVDNNFYSLLDDTYVDQRSFLNNMENPPTVEEVRQKWPVLFKKSAIIWHFKKLTNISLQSLEESFESKAENIVKYAISKNQLPKDALITVYKSCIEFYAKHFKEDISILIYKAQSDQCIPAVGILSPCLIEYSNDQYSIVFEKIEILKNMKFMEAFSLMFALYFVFNLEYPKKIGASLEMVQRYHLKIHPASGGKSIKSKNKVLNFMKKIAEV